MVRATSVGTRRLTRMTTADAVTGALTQALRDFLAAHDSMPGVLLHVEAHGHGV